MIKSLIVISTLLVCISFTFADNFAWTSFGVNNHNTRNANDIGIRPTLSSLNVELLGIESTYFTEEDGYITATPYVDGSYVFVPASDGYLYCFHRKPLILKWRVYLPDIHESEGDKSRTTPIRWKDSIIFGHRNGGWITAVNYYTGDVLWTSLAHDHSAATITSSPSLHHDVLYFGISSLEEIFAADPDYPCCSFVGKFVAMSAVDGSILHSFDTIVEGEDVSIGSGGYSGVGVWGSQPVIYEKKNAVIFATGNPYTVPGDVQECSANDPESFTCIPDTVYFNGVISLDLTTFQLNWYRRLSAYDAWVVACLFGGPNCPDVAGPDADFGMSPSLIEHVIIDTGMTTDVLMIAQKSGVVWNLDAMTGLVNCNVSVGPGGALGGNAWGSATDGSYYYSSNINGDNICHYIDWPVYTQTYAGSWSRVSVSTCSVSWIVPNPNTDAVGEDSPEYNPLHFGSHAVGPVSLVNDLVIATDASFRGSVFFIHKHSGTILKSFDTGATIYGGVSVYDNCIYFGHGYTPIFSPFYTSGHTFFEACVPQYGEF